MKSTEGNRLCVSDVKDRSLQNMSDESERLGTEGQTDTRACALYLRTKN